MSPSMSNTVQPQVPQVSDYSEEQSNTRIPSPYYLSPNQHALQSCQSLFLVQQRQEIRSQQPQNPITQRSNSPNKEPMCPTQGSNQVGEHHGNRQSASDSYQGFSNHALQDYQLQLLLLDQFNKRRLLRKRQTPPATVGASQTEGFPYRTVLYGEALYQIRLLRILSTNPSIEIETELCTFDFADCPGYVALSYVWGTNLPNSTIKVNGCAFTIGSNLLSVLRQLHYDLGNTAYIWIDAICIDQSNPREKSHVVQHMGAIFQQALSVYAWLGVALPNTTYWRGNDLLQQLDFLGGLFWKAAPNIGAVTDDTMMRHIFQLCWPSMVCLFDKPMEQGGFLTSSYNTLCARDYWTRIWVLQEVHLANELHFHVGDAKISLGSLSGALALLQAFRIHCNKRDGRYPEITRFMSEANPFPQMHRLVLYSTLYPTDVGSLRIAMTNFCIKDMTEGSRATDPRDVVYGLFGFATMEERQYISPRYDLNICSAYQAVTHAFLTNGWTDVLAWAQGPNKTIPGLPTWVPDYSATIHETLCSKSQAKPWLPQFQASGRTLLHSLKEFWNPAVISLAGFTVDSIERVGATLTYSEGFDGGKTTKGMTMVAANHLLRFLREARFLYQIAEQKAIRSPSMRATTSPDSIWRVPIADQIIVHGEISRCGSNLSAQYGILMETLEKNNLAALSDNVQPYVDGLLAHKGRRVFVTDGGFFGLGPPGMQFGDKVVLLEGFQAPYVIRPTKYYDFDLVGETYIDGMMDGELTYGSFPAEVFNLA